VRTVGHFAAEAEVQLGGREDADLAPERVVAVDADGRQRPHRSPRPTVDQLAESARQLTVDDVDRFLGKRAAVS